MGQDGTRQSPTAREGNWKRNGIRLNEASYQRLFTAQNGVCAICSRPPNGKSLAVDHDHKTGEVRGLLCWYCNKILIGNRKNPEQFYAAGRYLKEPPATKVSIEGQPVGKRLKKFEIDEAVKLAATGVSCRSIGRVFRVSKTAVSRHLNTPEAAEKLKLLREAIKHQVMERTAEELIGGAAKVATSKIAEDDAKGLDAATRAILNLEKASASAAGENRKVEVTGAGGAPFQVDVRAILASVLAHNTDPS